MTNGCILHLTFTHSKGAPLLQWADTHNLPNLKQQRNVYGDVVLVELGRDGENVLLVVVVPSALVVRDGELGRERRGTGQGGVLPGDVLGPGAQGDEDGDHDRRVVRRGGPRWVLVGRGDAGEA